MTVKIKVEVPTLDELAPAVRRCAEAPGEGKHPPLLRDAELQAGSPPPEPGIYVWSDPHGAVLYIGCGAGKTTNLVTRLQKWNDLLADYDPLGDWWGLSVVHFVKEHQGRPRWARATDKDAAEEAERRLIEWHRTRVGIAPLAVGWEAKKGSPRERGEIWAQALWDETVAGRTADPRVR